MSFERCKSQTNYSKRVCKEFSHHIGENEEIIENFEGHGIIPRSSDKALLTEDSVIIFEDGFLSKGVEDIPLSKISSTKADRTLLGGCSEFKSSTSQKSICGLFNKTEAKEFTHQIRNSI